MTDYTRLSMRERCNLTTLMDMGLNIRDIAKRLDRHRSTIYRELSRNHTQGRYRPGLAHHKAGARRPRKMLKLQTNRSLYHYVYDRLRKGWSPEQIVGRMRLEKQRFDICPEAIYQYVYQHGQKTLWTLLPSRRSKRQKRNGRKASKCRYGEIRLITKRPKHVEKRQAIGHWEGDLIVFAETGKKTITTLVERKTRMLILLRNTSKHSEVVMGKIKNTFSGEAYLPCKTITFDQGSEFARYHCIESSVKCKVYYCETHSPWQKGSNENMNGRLRRYLPRNTKISEVRQKDLDQLAERMNTLPRKCLGFRTPKELFLRQIKRTCRTRK